MHRDTLAARWGAIAVALHLVLVVPIVASQGYTWFLHLGTAFPPPIELARAKLGSDVAVPHEDGHDGRASWVLARDPFLLDGQTTATYLDRPAYRSQRIAYPLLAAPWRLFGERALVWALLLTNLAIVFAGTYLAVLLTVGWRGPPRASLAFAASPPVIVAVLGDLGDALVILGVLLVLWGLARGRFAAAVAGGVVVALAKDSTLLAIVPLALLWPSLTRRQRVLLIGIPAAALGAWIVYSRWRLGWPGTSVEEFTWPLGGFFDAWRRGWSHTRNWGDATAAFALIPFALYVCVRAWRTRSVLVLAAVPPVLLVPFFSAQVLDVLLNSLRAVGPAITLLWLDLYVQAPRATSSIARLRVAVDRAFRRS